MIVIPGAINFIKSRILIDFEGEVCRVAKSEVKVDIKAKLSRKNCRKGWTWLQIFVKMAIVFITGPLGAEVLVKIHCKLISKCSWSLTA